MNLPKLHLPTFDGSELRWPEFWHIFEASMHMQYRIFLRCQNLVTLRTLCGLTFVAISEISATVDNYDTAVTLMKEKFGSKESVLETHLCQATPDIKCSVKKLLRQLESQGEVNLSN